jgi:hypothetical protein
MGLDLSYIAANEQFDLRLSQVDRQDVHMRRAENNRHASPCRHAVP